ncbi:MAG: lamin tail domain-containing protein [Candidatus Woesearchaeota archaeon]
MKFLSYLAVFILLMQISNGIMLNEIMANTPDDAYNEWIELYNNGSIGINASGWIIGDGQGNDTIEGGLYNKEGTVIPAFGFAVVTDDATRVYNNFNVSNDAVRLYVSSIGKYGLNDNGETIYLYDNNGNLIDKLTYNKTTEDLSWAYLNGTLHKSNPTPGFNNDGSIIVQQDCNYAIEFILSKTMFENSSEFTFKVRASKVSGQQTNFTSRASIEDLNGKLIKEYRPFTNESITNQRTSTEYTPNLEEGKSYIMSANITVQCNDTSQENNFDTRLITIKGKPLREDSSIDIANIYDLGIDNKAKFGQTIRIRLNAYKGNTNKESVAVWIEDNKENRLSKQSKTNLDLKYTNYSLTLPIQIEPNCDEKFKDGDYIIKASGMDSEDEEEVEIEDLTDSMCEIQIIESKPFSSKEFNFELKDFDNELEVGKKFNAQVILDNSNNADIPIILWSYIYRGSKSYSGDREENKKQFVLEANSLQVVELSNIVEEAEPGDYKFKVIVNKNNQKTNSELTEDVIITGNLDENAIKTEKIDLENIDENEVTPNKITGNVIMKNNNIVYESTTEKAKNLAPIFIITLSIMINIVLVWRR